MGRRPTTGKFSSREDLEEEVRRLYFSTKCKTAAIASMCGVSHPTVSKIVNATNKAKSATQPKKKKNGSSLVGLYCSCWQKVPGIKRIPYTGVIVSGEEESNWWKLKVNGEQVTVSRGACGTPYER